MLNKTLRRVMVTSGLVAAATLAGSGLAAADEYPAPDIQWVNSNVIVSALDHDVATVTGKYRCFGGENEKTHLWVSVKQGPQIDPDKDQTSSSFARSWYDTNWNADEVTGEPLTRLDCNGKWQVYRATVKKSTWGDFEQLQNGPAWIQFCAFDSRASADPEPGDEMPVGFGNHYSWADVKVPSNSPAGRA